ncbi:ultraviolet-B receptor UVR8 isoform X1 [Chenopodium quinoa]|uniref:ultraviolet-B receptor UVR8 isoform X1 n=1 Tax=Chenopodium quinoa TaxID=63459 RepID=UPI000B793871|nr:ultraviolet-B receptor UVR8 isoform X1 [Chenopodium quinoa]
MEEQEKAFKKQKEINEEEQQEREIATETTQQQATELKQQELWSWGAGTEGQLGTGNLKDELTPQLLINLSNPLSSFGQISLLSCGGAHVIAITSGGKVLSWGRGASGQLGLGQIMPNSLYPKLVDSLTNFNISHVSAGWNHSGFVSDSGRLFTCGDGSFGQLGHGDYQSCSSPMEVSFFNSKHVEQIACGMRHSLVLLKGNLGDKVYGFGSGKRGQLGVSEDKIKSVSFPKTCSGLEHAEVVAILANGDQSAALSGSGRLYTWGRSFSSSSNVCIPQSVCSSLSFEQAALGWNHALVLTSEGEVFMLGGSHHGVLSEPQKMTHLHNSSGEPTLSKVTGLDGKKVAQIAAGAEHSAILTDDGQLYTWGWGEHGQLGLGSTSDHTVPQLVLLKENSLISRVYCGSGFTFALNI